MLSRQFVREHPEKVRDALDAKGVDADLDRILEVDEEWRELKARGDELRHDRNEVSSKIGELKQAGDEDAAQAAIERSQALKDELADVEARADDLEAELERLLLTLPMVPDEDAPVGDSEAENVERRREGFDDRRDLPESVVPHYDLGEELDILDFERGAKVSGGGFYFSKGAGARLEHALVQFMLDVHREQGYEDVFPPMPVSARSMEGTGQFPKFVEDAYRIGGENDADYDDDDLWLLPTAEVPVTNMYRDEILLDDDLPVKHQAYSPNFRREAGEHGTETRGIVRVHQFNKVELVNFVRPEDSAERFHGLLDEAEAVLRRLDLPYRVLEMCTGDMGFTQAKKYDIEVWAPGDDMDDGPEMGGRWLEVSSVSNFKDFQARRADIQYRPERHESAEHLHTLNGSGVAVPRVLVAILEYYQNDDGTVTVPEALQPYMNGQTRIEGSRKVGESALGDGDREA
ncbi:MULTISPECIES: serine--tRNA ligase [Halobacterium]|uniref:serine--tRNA ligase n=1 Tax=Halobacterium TaxID=2239 RepID=UPI0019659E3A|nr:MULTISPECIES: serine--tRNA ligase [Halobacterium]MDL0133844.1 serine--tRNA ligase [Halobacterium salinarum]MDL0139290.1 serine--tRNA ligase [Halobacterium salinarum]QRY22280.1 serine--tRNA ligase [Halobacterium sp. GSL-19]QRY24357.1 serine--tRNA ligase [Halobacterium sp. BOL4-2]WJK63652.1 serine--tRNA ligase [Halobacterium salinarum]